MEEWRDIEGYERLYQASNYGNVKSLAKVIVCKNGRIRHYEEKLLIPTDRGKGYLFVCLYKDGKKKQPLVHQLVAQTFIPNPLGLPEVNHKDEDKTNNRVENLEWCTHEYNSNYGTRNQRVGEGLSKKVYQYTLDGTLVKIWASANEAGRNGFNQGHVTDCCNNKYMREGNNIYKGFRWSYSPL